MKAKINYGAILTFYILAIACRYLTNKTDLLNGIENEYLKIILQGMGPAIGAIVVFYVFKIKPVLTLKGNYKGVVLPLLLFWALPIILISAVAFMAKGIIPVGVISAILLYGLLEELGWRGFLQQQLKPLPPIVNILVVALLWFIWHLNFELTTSNLFFLGILILGSWGIGKVADSTHSLLAVSAFHSLNNFFSELDATKTTILATLATIWILGIILHNKRTKNRLTGNG